MKFTEAVQALEDGFSGVKLIIDGVTEVELGIMEDFETGTRYLIMELENGWVKYVPLVEDVLRDDWVVEDEDYNDYIKDI